MSNSVPEAVRSKLSVVPFLNHRKSTPTLIATLYCPVCTAPTDSGHLSECGTCGGQWCDSVTCPATCKCDSLPSMDVLLGCAEDELRKFRLLEGKTTMSDLISSPRHVVILKDRAGRILFCSDTVVDLFGRTAEEMKGKIIFESMTDDAANRDHYNTEDCIKTLKPVESLTRLTCKRSGEECAWYVVKVAISEDGADRCDFILALYRNVTALLKKETA